MTTDSISYDDNCNTKKASILLCLLFVSYVYFGFFV